MAAVLAVGDDAVLSKGSAGFSLGLRKAPATVIVVLIPHTRRVRGVDGVDVQRCRDLQRRTDEHAHPPRTTVEHTVLDLAEGGTADEAIALAALACQKGLTRDEALLAALARRRGHRWGTLLTEALVDIGAGAQSTFEVRYVRDVERAHGLPPGRPQQPTGGGRRHHDYGYAEQRVLWNSTGWPSTRARRRG